MLQTRIEKDYRVTIPESLRSSLQVGDELLVSADQAGRIVLTPIARLLEILERTAGMWEGRNDVPADGVEYVNRLRQGRRLQSLGVIPDDRD
jgi:hypothetical protein